MAIDFPNTPTNGQVFTVGDRSWQWSSTSNLWESVATYGNTSAEITAKTFTGLVSTTTTELDFSSETFKTISISSTTTFTASNYSTGRTITVRVTSDATQRTINFPTGWIFVGTKPTFIAASKVGILTVTSFGTTEGDCIAAWAVQT